MRGRTKRRNSWGMRLSLMTRRRLYANGAIRDVARAAFDAVVDGNLRRRSESLVVVGGHAERGSQLFVEAAHAEKLVGIRGKLPAVIGEEKFLVTRVPQTCELAVHQDGRKNRHNVVVIRSTAKLRAAAVFF